MKPMKGKLLCAALALLLFLQTGCAGQQSRETVPVGNLQESVDLLTEELEALDAPPAQDLGLPVPGAGTGGIPCGCGLRRHGMVSV